MEKLSQDKMLEIKAAMAMSKAAKDFFDDKEDMSFQVYSLEHVDVFEPKQGESSETDKFRFDVHSKTLELDLNTLIIRRFKFSLDEESWIVKEITAKRLPEKLLWCLFECGYGRDLPLANSIVDAVIDGRLSVSFLYSLLQKRYNFSDDVLVLIVQSAIEAKISCNFITELMSSGYELPNQAKKLILDAVLSGNFDIYYLDLLVQHRYDFSDDLSHNLIVGTIEGKVSPQVLQKMLNNGYEFSLGNWKVMFNSNIDFMVKACLEKFYPDLVEIL